MLTKRIISLVTIIALMVTMLVVPVTLASANQVDVAATEATNATAYNIPSKIDDGNILQAFSWKLKEVTQYAQEIAEAGYSAVQISPIQHTKNTTNDGAYANDWWSFYQPVDFTIGNELGTAQDLKEMCDTLHSYGVKVIADVVTNHTMECVKTDTVNKLSTTMQGYLRRNQYSHTMTSDNTRISQVQDDLGGNLSDINTANKDYQNYVIKYLNSLADCGVDGYRFDAAKHIETPDDPSGVASDYWPTVIGAIKQKNPNAYIYGEILNPAGKFNISSYTKYMDVTDYAFGGTVRSALTASKKSASSLVNYGFSGTSKNQNVLWIESHDNFCDGTSASAFKGKPQLIVAGWAAIASRKDAPALFFPRPKCETTDAASGKITYDELIGAPGSLTTWKDPTVAAVNRFKNEFVGQSENVTSSGANLFVQRGTTGMVIVNLNTTSISISQSCTMANGTYTDQVSGNKFTVSGGKISGNVGSTGVAVIYNPTKAVPVAKVLLNNSELTADTLNRYTGSTATVTVKLENAASGTVKVSNLPEKAVPASGLTFTLNSSIAYGKGVNITVTATNGSQTSTKTYKVYKKNSSESKRVYFDNAVNQWGNVYVYCKTGLDRSTQISAFPGIKMTQVSGNANLYYADVPSNTNYVKFSEGPVTVHIGHSVSACGGYCGRTMPPTVIYYGTANNAANRESGGYQLVGSMILQKLEWKDYGDYPIANLSSTDVIFPGDTHTSATEATTATEIIVDPNRLIYGDTDLSGAVEITDATTIQRHLAKIITFNSQQMTCGDVDADGQVTIADATWIQRRLAKLDAPERIGKNVQGEVVIPTNPIEYPTDPPIYFDTVTVTLNNTTCFAGGEVYVYAYNLAGSSNAEWPGQKMTKTATGYTAEIDSSLDLIKFLGYYGDVAESSTGAVYANTVETNEFALSSTPYTLETVRITANQKWNKCNIHLWNETPPYVSTKWPGVPMQGTSGNYYYDLPKESGYTSYKLNNGSGAESQTLTVPSSSVVSPTNGTDPTGDMTVYFTNIPNWSKVCAYAWNGGNKNAEWPGQEMTYVETNNQGQKVYKISLKSGAYNKIIFNNGNGTQTVDLDLGTTNNQGFYTTNQASGKYNCSTYIYG